MALASIARNGQRNFDETVMNEFPPSKIEDLTSEYPP